MAMPGQGLGNLTPNQYTNRRTEDEVDAVLDWAADMVDGRKVRGGRTFEEGVEAALHRVFGMSTTNPKDVS